VLVVGDVNSTLACSLVAVKRRVPVVHVEAGLRSYDRAMPEEINRVLTDQIADVLYTTERVAHDNLAREGVDESRARFVGNVMIDSLVANRMYARASCDTLLAHGFSGEVLQDPRGYGLVTLHRPSNVDDPQTLESLLSTLRTVAERLPLVFALHPRTRANIKRFGLEALTTSNSRMVLLPPQGYLEMLGLMAAATVVLTDSGGVQEETTALGVPCLTLRENTERPITIDQGTNTLVGTARHAILQGVDDVISGHGKRGCVPELWDGRAAERIAADLAEWLIRREARAEG
jgi:UDP-N-acetylglucosamine 2-epimerase (non-hydrolysing)